MKIAKTVILWCLVVAVLAGCEDQEGDGTSTEKQEAANSSSAADSTAGPATSGAATLPEQASFEVDVAPINNPGVRGGAVFTQRPDGVWVELKVSGLPQPQAAHFARIHEGACGEEGHGQGREEPREAHDARERGIGRSTVALMRADRLITLAFGSEYAQEGHDHDGSSQEPPDLTDLTIPLPSSAEGRGATSFVLSGMKLQQLTSESPLSLDLVQAVDSGAALTLGCAAL